MREDVARLLRECQPPVADFALTPLAGDASGRRYFRVAEPGTGRTWVLMVLDARGGCEEVGSDLEEGEELPFLQVQRFLASLDLPVPRIHAWDPDCGLMLLDDFGDTTLYAWLDGRSEAEVRARYLLAIEHLVKMQVDGGRRLDAAGRIARQHFTRELLQWELDHFVEFAVERAHGPLPPAIRARLDAVMGVIAAELAALPPVVVHRDYHSRNLMVVGEGLGIIDFQDALLGPAVYDLVSLLNDAYVSLPEGTLAALKASYIEAVRQRGGAAPSEEAFNRAFDLAALQRSLKAAGRFHYFLHTAGNDRYLGYVPRTLTNARRALDAHADLAPFRELLAPFVPAFA